MSTTESTERPPQPQPCKDCVEVYGDDPWDWMLRWPEGAEYSAKYGCHLCDGCHEEREDLAEE